MKKCPQCGTQYSDVTLSFCLQDGTPLIVAPQTDTPTVVLGEEEAVAARRDAVRIPVGDPQSDAWGQSQVTHVASPQSEKKGSKMALAIGLTVAGMLLLFGIIGIAAIVFLRNAQHATLENVNIRPNTNIGVPNANFASPYTTLSPVPSPAITPINSPRPSPIATPPPPPTVLSSYPSTTRLKFSRGSYSTSFSGDVNPGDTRSLVLSCRSGQSLSANISGSGCVNIRGGGSSFRTTTRGGDNYVTIVSTCSTVARFTVTISVI